MNDSKEWLASLKAGDEVAIRLDYGSRHIVRRVDRVTPTQVIVEPSRYRKSDGRRIGDDAWTYVFLTPVTPAIRDEIERARLIHKVSERHWADVPTDTLRKIVALLNAPEEK